MRLIQIIKNVAIISISLFLLILTQTETSFAQEYELGSSDSSYISNQEDSSEEAPPVKEETEATAQKDKADEFSEAAAVQSTAMSSTSDGDYEKEADWVYSKPQGVSVSQVGAATLSYPIEIPPGRNGLQPNISLQYSSYNGNGWVGVGWDLNMGSISRSTRYGLNYSANVYVADGSDLVSRTSDWGANYYGAKIEGAFTKYYLNTSSNSWLATAKDGTKYYYGSSSNSRMTNAYGTYSWNLDRIEDTNGNYISIEYTTNQGQIYPYRIYYTYHTTHFNGPNDYSYRVEFGIEDREDNINSYKTHSLVTTAKRLETITVKQKNGTTVYKYILNYNNSGPNGRSRLAQIKRVDPDNPDNSLPPYDFTYYDGGDGTFTLGTPPNEPMPIDGPAMGLSNIIVFGDINGDGMQDFVKAYAPKVEDTSGSYVTVYTYLAKKTGGFTYQGLTALEKCPSYSDGYSWLNFMSVSLGDVNGDGFADIMSNGMNGQVHVYLSEQDEVSGIWGFSDKHTTQGAANCQDNVFLADLDGDGKSDLVMSSEGGYIFTYLSNGNGYFDSQVSDVVGGGTPWSTSIQIADFNGDGKADVLSCDNLSAGGQQGINLRVFYGDGFGAFDEMVPSVYYEIVTIDFGFYNLKTLDANGDGLTDIAYVDNSWDLVVHLSTGTGMTSGTHTTPYPPYDQNSTAEFADLDDDGMDDLIWNFRHYFYKSNGDGTFADPVNYEEPLRVDADIDGDGRKDMIGYSPSTSSIIYAYANGEDAVDCIASVTNPLGGKTDIFYSNSSEYPNNKMPFILHPVKTIEAYDGIIEEGDNEDIPDVTKYAYANPYYDHVERDSRGFGYVKKTNPDDTTIETTYELYNNYKKGRPLTEVMKEEGWSTPLMETTYIWGTYPETPATWAFVKRNQKKTIYENNASYYTQEDYTYDNINGFQEFVIKNGTDANGQAIEQVTQFTGYSLYGTNAWRVSKEVVAESYNKVSDTATGLARKMTYNYDGSGNITHKIFWRTASNAYNAITYTHDGFGKVTSETDGLNHTTTIQYETNAYTFPWRITNAKNQVTTKTWDYRFGKEDTVTDPNNNTTDYNYDDFGRISNINYPDGGHTENIYTYFDGTTFPRYIITRTLESGSISTGSYIEKEEYFDGLGRTIKVVTDGIDDQAPPNAIQILTDTSYDKMGRISKVEGPYFYNTPAAQHYYEKTYYDKLGRVDYIETPSGVTGVPSVTDYFYNNPFTTVIKDPDNKLTTEKRDHLGRIIEVIEHANTGLQRTYYGYNAADDMTYVENVIGYPTLIDYDARGLKTSMDDPDMGIWSYTYDENGNLSTQTDTKENLITFNYDELNRVYNKIYTIPASEPQNTPNVEYRYDGYGLSSCTNCIGQLTSVNNTNVLTKYDLFDPMGRDKRVIKTISGDQARITQTSYDLSGKVTSIIHPDNYTVTNTFYPGTGLLNTVTGTPSGGSAVEYARCTEYEPTGKIRRINHTYNGTKTIYTYDAKTTRLATLLTSGPAPGNVTIQNKSYAYSKAGDIKTITDLMPGGFTYTYVYDNLHRLQGEATSDNTAPTSTERLTYSYDDSEHINAVTSINYNGTNYDFDYDPNGNMIEGWDFTDPNNIVQRGFTWNADNMPVSVTRGGVATSLTYDGDGVRAKKVAGGVTTYYVSNDDEIKNGTPIKYIFAGNLRVAEIEGAASTIFHKDHLGSSTAMTNSAGTKVEATEYLPFGVQRSHSGTNTSDYLYTDQEFDNESGLYNYDARLYDPVIGRFISADSVVPATYNPQSLNRYSYVYNNPLVYTDPNGHIPAWVSNWFCGLSGGWHIRNNIKDLDEKAYVKFQDFFNPQLPEDFVNWTEEERWDYIKNVHIKKSARPIILAAELGAPAGGGKKISLSLWGRFKSMFKGKAASTLKLSDDIAKTFADGKYHTRILQNDVVAYRFSGGSSAAEGQWLTTRQTVNQINSPSQAISQLNLPPGATASELNQYIIPKGTTIFYGRVAGGGQKATQIYIIDKSVLKVLQ